MTLKLYKGNTMAMVWKMIGQDAVEKKRTTPEYETEGKSPLPSPLRILPLSSLTPYQSSPSYSLRENVAIWFSCHLIFLMPRVSPFDFYVNLVFMIVSQVGEQQTPEAIINRIKINRDG